MLKLNLSPVRSDDPQQSVEWTAPKLMLDSAEYDLSELPDGATAQHPVLGKVSREGNDYELTLRLPHGANAPESTRFPESIIVTKDGPVELPIYNTPEPEITDDLA